MSAASKRLERLKARPPRIAFSEVEKVLEDHGFMKMAKPSGHFPFVRDDEYLVVPTQQGRWVKREYIVRVLKAIGNED